MVRSDHQTTRVGMMTTKASAAEPPSRALAMQRFASFWILAAAWAGGVADAAASTSAASSSPRSGSASTSTSESSTADRICPGTPALAPALSSDATFLSDLRSYFELPTEKDALPPPLQSLIRAQLSNLQPFLSKTRRDLHRFPELMYQEERTSGYIQEALTSLGVPYTAGWGNNTRREAFEGPGGYGVVAHIGTRSSPCVILRADMDGLPVSEETGRDFASETEGNMHACGHDGHVTMLLGAAAVLKSMEPSIRGTVRLVFQPAEEGGAGGKRMVEEGVVSLHPPASHAFGMHIWPTLPLGQIGVKKGALLGAYERFTVTLRGVGGHAAMPHQTSDPIVASASIVTALQTLVSRRLSPLESGVVSVTHIHSGSGAYNVIPPDSEIRGTIRALSTETLLSLRDQVEDMIKSIGKAHGCQATVEYAPDYYPPTVNDPDLYPVATALAWGVGTVVESEPTMGAEDFGFLAEAVPSMFFLLGQKQTEEVYGLHHPKFDIREDVLAKGAELHVTMALGMLRKLLDEGST